MKFYRINENTIKCLIPIRDLEEYGITIDDMMEKRKDALDFLRRIVDMAADEVGFEEKDKLTSMQVAVVNQDMVVLVASKENAIQDVERLLEELKKQVSRGIASLLRQKEGEKADQAEGTAGIEEKTVDKMVSGLWHRENVQFVFHFDAMKDLLRLVAMIPTDNRLDTALYKDAEDGLLLAVSVGEDSLENFGRFYFKATEFGKEIAVATVKKNAESAGVQSTNEDVNAFIKHIKEQCTCIIPERALQVLGTL